VTNDPTAARRYPHIVPSDPTVTRLVSASNLKRQRGWTEGLIGTLLGAPDALAPNPHGFRAPMRYFAEDRALAAEREPAFSRWAATLDDRRSWRRAQPTRVVRADEIEHLEWLDDPWRLALFLAPRIPRRPRPRTPPPPPPKPLAPGLRFEVLRLFEI
jgi:hypothetical protein